MYYKILKKAIVDIANEITVRSLTLKPRRRPEDPGVRHRALLSPPLSQVSRSLSSHPRSSPHTSTK